MYKNTECPFKVGDYVRFCPSERTIGWYMDIERAGGLKIGAIGKITRISKNMYLYFDKDSGGLPWTEYQAVEKEAL